MTASDRLNNRSFVTDLYDGAVSGSLDAVVDRMAESFVATSPTYLPWGGVVRGRAAYLRDVIPRVAQYLEFSRFAMEGIVADDDQVVARIRVGVRGTSDTVVLSEHFGFSEGLATRIWVAYFDPAPLVEVITRR